MYKLILLYSSAMSLKLKEQRHYVTLTKLAFGSETPSLGPDSPVRFWWDTVDQTYRLNRAIDQEEVARVLDENCKPIAYLKPMMLNLMSTTTDPNMLPGVSFVGEILKLHQERINIAIDTAEVVVATRFLSLERKWLQPVHCTLRRK